MKTIGFHEDGKHLFVLLIFYQFYLRGQVTDSILQKKTIGGSWNQNSKMLSFGLGGPISSL